MELCEDYGIPPFFCIVVREYDLPKADTVDDSIKLIAKRLTSCMKNFVIYPIYGANGTPSNRILIEFKSREAFTEVKKIVSGGLITVDTDQYPVEFVYETSTKPRKDRSPYRKVPLRKLKLFSGAEKVSGGEIDAREWLSQASDLIDNEKELKEDEKMRILRNSLVKQALLLVSSSEVHNCRELLDLIALTYGEAHSVAHLRYKFYQMQQGPTESASLFLSRLQDTLKEYGKVDPSVRAVEAEVRFKVFSEGLKPDYFDLMNIHIGLESMMVQENFPDFPKLLRLVQSFERNRRERFERSHDTTCGALQAIPLGKNLETSSVTSTGVDSTLQKEVDELKKQLASMSSSKKKQKKQGAACAAVSVEEEQQMPKKPGKSRYSQRVRTCWNCGEQGHIVFSCPKTWDADAVKDHVSSVRQRINNQQKERQQPQQFEPTEGSKNE